MAKVCLTTRDVRQLVDLASRLRAIPEPVERRTVRMQAMTQFLHAEVAGLNLVDLPTGSATLHTYPQVFADPVAVLRGVLTTHPLIAHYMRPGADSPYRLSEVPGGRSARELIGTPLHDTMLRQIGLRQLAVPILVDRPRGGVAYTLNRSGADFDDRERDRAVGLQLVLSAMHHELPVTHPSTAGGIPARPGNTSLTERQWEVVYLLVQGHEVDEVARMLTVSPLTVRTHRRDAYARIDVHSLRQAAIHVHDALVGTPSFEDQLVEELSS